MSQLAVWIERLVGPVDVGQYAKRGRTIKHKSKSRRSVPGMSLSSVMIPVTIRWKISLCCHRSLPLDVLLPLLGTL